MYQISHAHSCRQSNIGSIRLTKLLYKGGRMASSVRIEGVCVHVGIKGAPISVENVEA